MLPKESAKDIFQTSRSLYPHSLKYSYKMKLQKWQKLESNDHDPVKGLQLVHNFLIFLDPKEYQLNDEDNIIISIVKMT